MFTYRVSWEEFLSFQQESRPSVTYASIVAVVVPPFVAALAFLILFEPILSRESFLATTGLWLLSIFLSIAVFSEFVVSGKRRRIRTVEESRYEYEQYHSGERTFEFDETKWVLITGSSRAQDSWVNLKFVTEWLAVVTIFVQGHVLIVLPKRVLSPEELDRLRKIVYRPQVTWRSYLNTLDFIFNELLSRWRSHPYTATAAHLLGLSCFAVIVKDIYHSTGAGEYRRWSVAGLFLIFTLTAEIWYLLAIYIGSLGHWRKLWTFGVSATGVYMKTSRTESFVSWNYFEKCRETTRCYLLHVNSSQYYVWPKRDIPTEHRNQVHQLLQQYLKPKA